MEQEMSEPQRPHLSGIDARACLASYLTFGAIFPLLAIFGLFVVIKTPNHSYEFVYIPAAIGVGIALWLRAFRLTIADGELTYRTLFGSRSIRVADIERAETQLVATGRGSYRVLVINPRPETMQEPIRVNIKVFSREDLRCLFDLLGSKFRGSRTIGVYTSDSV